MAQSPANQFSGIFVSYRRDDSSGHAGRLFDRMVDHFGRDRVFMDIDTIEPGEDFVTVIENAVGSCEILLAVIGRNWLSGTGRNTGHLRDPNDFVRLEIATALKRDIRVIPILVQRASMPKPEELPEDLVKLSRRNAVELSDLRWQNDVHDLIGDMEGILDKQDEAKSQAAKTEAIEAEPHGGRPSDTEQISREPQSEIPSPRSGGQPKVGFEKARATDLVIPLPRPVKGTRRLYLVLEVLMFVALLGGGYYIRQIVRNSKSPQTNSSENPSGQPSPTATTAAPGFEDITTTVNRNNGAGNSSNSNSINPSNPSNSNRSTRVSAPRLNEAARLAASSNTGEAERQRKALDALEEKQRQQRAIDALSGGKPAMRPSP